ncbi:MAG: chemotaxis protein CheW [bacterium]|nr:chemotaxis protein CheW [bacterium]
MKKKIDLQDILTDGKTEKKVKPKIKKNKVDIAAVKVEEKEKAQTVISPKPVSSSPIPSETKPEEARREKQPEMLKTSNIKDASEKSNETDVKKEYVTFLLKNEEYAIDSDFVRQIIKYKKPLDVGIKSDLFFGVANIKDGVLPLVDFKRKFGLGEERKDDGSIIILQIDDLRVGVYVDYLVGIVRFRDTDIKAIPPFLPEAQLSFVSGIGIKEGKFKKIIIILNHLNLFSREDIREMKRIPEMYK